MRKMNVYMVAGVLCILAHSAYASLNSPNVPKVSVERDWRIDAGKIIPVLYIDLEIDQAGIEACFQTGLDKEGVPPDGIKLFPNPNKGSFRLELSEAREGENLRVSVYNVLGELVYLSDERVLSARFEKEFDLDFLKPGIFFIYILGRNMRFVEQLIIH
jgi:hypothetical protein